MIATPHMLTLDLAGVYLAKLLPNQRHTVIKRDLANSYFDRWVMKERATTFDTVSKFDGRGILRVIQKKGVLCIICDQFYGAKGSVRVPFFGHKTGTVNSPAYFAKSKDAIIDV